MKTSFIEDVGDKQIAYDSILVPPKNLNIFNSDLSLKIINELVRNPGCAMDLARKLEQHEQKIYYHLRKLEKVGIIKQIRTEKRYGMDAKIYSVVSPVISTKLYDDGYPIEKSSSIINHEASKFFYPFIDDGKLNAKIIIGYPYPHGKYDKSEKGAAHAFDFAIFIGKFLKKLEFPHYVFDVDTRGEDLDNNLILIGNPESNTIIDRINSSNPKLPVHFDNKRGGSIVSSLTGNVYEDPIIGMVLKWQSPFNKNKKILVLSGIRTRGIHAAMIAVTQHLSELIKNSEDNGNLMSIVQGLDKDGDKIIDSVKFLE
jgi:DNA-binding transcriptional ArsR family regulator